MTKRLRDMASVSFEKYIAKLKPFEFTSQDLVDVKQSFDTGYVRGAKAGIRMAASMIPPPPSSLAEILQIAHSRDRILSLLTEEPGEK